MKHPMMRLSLTLSDTITVSSYCTNQIKPISVESNCHFVTNPITFQMSANHIRYCLRFSAHCTKLPRNDTSGRQEVVGGVMDTKKASKRQNWIYSCIHADAYVSNRWHAVGRNERGRFYTTHSRAEQLLQRNSGLRGYTHSCSDVSKAR